MKELDQPVIFQSIVSVSDPDSCDFLLTASIDDYIGKLPYLRNIGSANGMASLVFTHIAGKIGCCEVVVQWVRRLIYGVFTIRIGSFKAVDRFPSQVLQISFHPMVRQAGELDKSGELTLIEIELSIGSKASHVSDIL